MLHGFGYMISLRIYFDNQIVVRETMCILLVCVVCNCERYEYIVYPCMNTRRQRFQKEDICGSREGLTGTAAKPADLVWYFNCRRARSVPGAW